MATKTYKKFLTGAATAAMVASAVAPVAAQGQDVAEQANTSFSDIGPSSSHYTNVIEARELGFLSGYTDGTFKPNKDLNRGDVAKMLGKYVVATSGLTLDEYVAENNIADVENFSDVQDDAKDQELVTYSKIVKDAGIFKGSNNNLMATKLMPRDQIAAVLVRAFDLEDKEGTTEVEDGANSGYVKEIEILLENGVSNANPYRPFETTSRAQFASFLVRAYKVSEGLDPSKPLPEEPGEETPEEPGTDWDGNISVEASKANISADGKDTTVLTFSILDEEGNVDTDADDIVLRVNTTHGAVNSERITVQNGVATATLTSEQSNSDLEAKIEVTVIEAGEGHKHLIGEKAATATIGFIAYDQAAETLNVTGAEANQADRVTLFFDRAVELEDLVQTHPSSGELLYQYRLADDTWSAPVVKSAIPALTPPENVKHALEDGVLNVAGNFGHGQNDGIQGLKPVEGNDKALEVILAKDSYLTDNTNVAVAVNYVSEFGKPSVSATSFVFTDDRTVEATSVTNEDLRTIEVKFSESIHSANFVVDGQYDVTDVEYGEFDVRTLEDNRDKAYLTLGTDYDLDTPPTVPGYMAAGDHTVQVSNMIDTSQNRTGHTQNLNFTVAANTTTPSATVDVASPEQFHVTFNAPVANVQNFKLQVYNETTEAWEDVVAKDDNTVVKPVVTRVAGNEYTFEINKDWTVIFDTQNSKDNYYNHEFRLRYETEALTNEQNGLRNRAPINLDLNYDGSALNNPDTTSPTIESVNQIGNAASFNVIANEPIKIPGRDVNVGDTLSQEQAQKNNNTLPEAKVTFYATDRNGKTVTVPGYVRAFTDATDTGFRVDAAPVTIPAVIENGVTIIPAGQYNLQELVDLGYFEEDFSLSVSQLTDDVGNTADTITHDFSLAASTVDPAATPFFIETAELDGTVVTVTFSEGVVSNGGVNDATNVAQWSINGGDLPAGTSIVVEDNDAAAAGNETVVITLPADFDFQTSNAITLNREVKSHDGSPLVGTNTFVVGAQ